MKDEALRLALDALKTCQIDGDGWSGPDYWFDSEKVGKAITAIKQALAQPEPEPVAWVDLLKEAQKIVESKPVWKRFIDGTPLANDIACWMADFAQQHTSPPKREWQGLTDDEIKQIEETTTCEGNESWLRNLTRNIEAKLKERNT